MQLRIAIYYSVAAATVAYAARRGGEPERWVAALIVVASLATSLIPYDPARSYRTVLEPLLIVDTLLLLAVGAIALVANRFWPMYFCAIHMLAVALHGVRAYDPDLLPIVYARLGGELAYPVLFLVIAGTWRHRNRLPERDWSWQIERETG